MAGETTTSKTTKSADLAKVSSIDFVESFTENIRVLMELLGITRKVEKIPGQVIKTYKVAGTLESGEVGEGEDIPLSKYKTETASIFELTLKKYRKQTTLEAIADKGYDQAVVDTDNAMLRQVQGVIRNDFFTTLGKGKGTASGKGLKGALAQTRATIHNSMENYGVADSDIIYMVNPFDIADYLEDTDVTVQEAFGMTYIKNFLGLYNVLEYGSVPKGKVYATHKDNLILYFTNPANSDVAQAFEFTTDETGYIGIHHDSAYKNLTTDTVVLVGLQLCFEIEDFVFIATIKKTTTESGTGTSGSGNSGVGTGSDQ